MEAGETARAEPHLRGRLTEPGLPPSIDGVMADVGWVAEEERDPLDPGQAELAVVADDDVEARFKSQDVGAGASHEGGVGVEVYRDPCRAGEGAQGGQYVPAGTAAGIDDARRDRATPRPLQHGPDDGRGSECLAVRPALLSGSSGAEGPPERVLAFEDETARLLEVKRLDRTVREHGLLRR